ncbi:MAG: hypothetical protein COV66_10340 [Nitrospinae bacterium CG11_big_fil_rev_8_21_14_0_20_45_15]|nr:MAG: hypothetical protein COV66_10340 [Nitrospinae bacterium CG11_big_fil_rev_8_21_14_0_20_45_15]
MRFRYKLDKKTFKNKKVAPKRMPGWDQSHIDEDQKGDHSSGSGDVLSLDHDAISNANRAEIKKKNDEQREMSRRDLFSFMRVGEFAEAVEEEEEKKRKTKRKGKDRTEDSAELEECAEGDEQQQQESIAVLEEEPEEPAVQKGFFRRMVDKIRPGKKSVSEEVSEDVAPAVAGFAENARSAMHESYEEEPEEEIVQEEPEAEYDRRNLLKQGIHFFAKPAMDSVQSKIDRVNETVDKITKRIPLIRPPGALSEKDFLNACTRCDKCIHACPKDAIKKVPKKMGFFIMGTPYIEPLKNPCVMCDGLPCISACPDGALEPLDSPADVKMGYAILDKHRCQAYGDTFCQQCVIDCPIPGAITQNQDNQPTIHKNICTGCGVCAHSCSAVNIPVAIKIKPQMIIEHQLKKKRLEKEKAEREIQERIARAQWAQEEKAEKNTEPDETLSGN